MAALEAVVGEIDIFVSCTGPSMIITPEHMKKMKSNANADQSLLSSIGWKFIRLHLSEASTEAKASFHNTRPVVRFSVDGTSTWAGTVAAVAATQIWNWRQRLACCSYARCWSTWWLCVVRDHQSAPKECPKGPASTPPASQGGGIFILEIGLSSGSTKNLHCGVSGAWHEQKLSPGCPGGRNWGWLHSDRSSASAQMLEFSV